MLAIWSLVPLPFLNQASTSGSSCFMYCWSLTWRIFEHYLANMWNECNCAVVWTFFGIALLWDWDENWPGGHYWVFQSCWHVECNTFIASSQDFNSSAWILSPPLALSVIMLPKAHLTSCSRMSGSSWCQINGVTQDVAFRYDLFYLTQYIWNSSTYMLIFIRRRWVNTKNPKEILFAIELKKKANPCIKNYISSP